MTTETVKLTVDLEISYENEQGREYLVDYLEREILVNMSGGSGWYGTYSAKSIPGRTKVD